MTLRDQIHRECVNRPFQFNKRSQLFVGTHDETLRANRSPDLEVLTMKATATAVP
jgi:hypothetical protein